MKKLLTLVLFIAMMLCVVSGCAKKESSTEDVSLKNIQDRGTFILGLDDSFSPLGFRDEKNNIVGYDIDLAREVCKRLGVELKLQPIDWAAKEQELNTGKIDCIWNGFTITPERLEALSFTDPYLNNAQVVIVRNDANITTLADLAGKKVALQAGSSASDALNKAVEFKASLKEVVELKDNLIALMDLETKGVDAVVMDMVVGSYSINTTGKPFAILEESLGAEEYGIGFRKNDIALRDAVNNALIDMAKDGTTAAISTSWFGSDISTIGK